jgi:hypothetical protein
MNFLTVNNPIRYGYQRERAWKANELALLGTLPDEDVAAKTGGPANEVRVMRTKKGIASAHD